MAPQASAMAIGFDTSEINFDNPMILFVSFPYLQWRLRGSDKEWHPDFRVSHVTMVQLSRAEKLSRAENFTPGRIQGSKLESRSHP